MEIILENPRFHGKLLDMIGKTADEALAEAPSAERVNENGRAQRLVWKETARDTETGKAFPLFLMARVLDGKVWAVGLWAPLFAFRVEKGDGASWYFRAVEKPEITNFKHVNWVGRKKDGYENLGLGE